MRGRLGLVKGSKKDLTQLHYLLATSSWADRWFSLYSCEKVILQILCKY